MFFDFHTHIFPNKIAERAVGTLVQKAETAQGEKGCLTPHTDGTLDGIKASMERSGIDGCLILPVCTKPEQFDSINRFASEINGKDGVYSFGGIHPECDDIEGKLGYIKSLGLKGVKLHPAYQNCFIDDTRNLKIAEACIKMGLYCLFHAGYDIAYPETEYCPPDRFEKAFAPLFKKYPDEEKEPHIILAHLGGVASLDGTLEYLCGLPIYMDTAYTLEQIPTDMLVKVIRSHGAERILFGSDSPWQSQLKCRERLASLPISKKEFEAVSCGNARKILGI